MYALSEVMIVSHIDIVFTEPTPKLFQFLSFNVHVLSVYVCLCLCDHLHSLWDSGLMMVTIPILLPHLLLLLPQHHVLGPSRGKSL